MSSEVIKPITLKPVSATDKFLLLWGRESLKQIVPSLNDVLSKLLTLSTALVGAGVVAAKEGFVPFWWAVASVSLLICSLTLSLWGLYPVGREIDINSPEQIAQSEWQAARRKSRSLNAAFVFLVLALVVSIIGVAYVGPNVYGKADAIKHEVNIHVQRD